MSNYRGCMEVNFFGTLNVTKTFLPLLRQAKGRIVTISSPAVVCEYWPLMFLNYGNQRLLHSPYRYSSNREYWERQYKTLIHNLSAGLLEEYGEDYTHETKDLFQRFAQSANEDLSPVINTISEALLSPQPLVRYYAGPGVGLMYFIYSYFPLSLSDKFLQRLFFRKKIIPRALRKENGLTGSLSLSLSLNNNNNDVEKIKK
uniref:Hydroxysteroid (11-beta) dehydrogenase 2 n=1 Tax=Hucho hucho TaxID=62062 RepID=A0A4W5P7I0_9TELE